MPKIVNHEERRARIVSSSTSLIAEQGFDQLTIRGLAEALDISTGMITYYFKSKDEILFAALQGVHERFFQRVEKALAGKEGVEAIRLRLQVSLPLTKEIKRDWSVMFQFWGRATHHKSFSSFMNRQHREVQKLDTEHILRAQALGEISADLDPTNVFEQLDAMAVGMGITCVFNPSRLNKQTAYSIIDGALEQLAPSE